MTPSAADHERVLRCGFADGNNTSVEGLIGNCLADSYPGLTCSACQGNVYFHYRIDNPPEVLFVQALRADTDSQGKSVKLTNEVSFGEEMTLNLGGSDGTGKTQYELCAVIFHLGPSPGGGHYIVAVKGPTGQWSTINDNQDPLNVQFSTLQASAWQKDATLFVYRKKATGYTSLKLKVPTKPDNNDKKKDKTDNGNQPQPMTLNATIELPGGFKWTFNQSMVLPSDGDGLKLDQAKTNAAKVRVSLTEPSGELLQGEANVQLQGQGKATNGGVKGGAAKRKYMSPDRKSSRVKKQVKGRR